MAKKKEQGEPGRPEKVIEETQVKFFAAQDLSARGIARALGVSPNTLYTHFPDGKLQQLIAEGREEGNEYLLSLAWRAARKGDGNMQRFLIKKRIPRYADKGASGDEGGDTHLHLHQHSHFMQLPRDERLKRIAELRQELQLPAGTTVIDAGDAHERKQEVQKPVARRASS